MATLKVLAALLHYPDEALQAHAAELLAALDADGLVRGARRAALRSLVARLRDEELLELQSEYVETFDRGRSRSLYLFEHVYGESRDRGQAMVELIGAYREHGLEIAAAELPDYLPLFLEFLSRMPVADALGWLEEIGPVLQLLHARLAARPSPYAVVLEPLVRLAGLAPEAKVDEQVAAETPDDTPEALDRVWMESPVSFGGPEDSCGAAQDKTRNQESARSPTPTETVRWQDPPAH